jgi:hypothetical protein
MGRHPMETFARELREALESGAFARSDRVELSDGVTVNPTRMARIVLVDFERVARGQHRGWLAEGEEQALYEDLLRLHFLARHRYTST